MNEYLEEIRKRDSESAETWFRAPNSGSARAFQDRRWLLGEILRLQTALDDATRGYYPQAGVGPS